MKARIKETGEIINISDYARVTLDKCDSYGTSITNCAKGRSKTAGGFKWEYKHV